MRTRISDIIYLNIMIINELKLTWISTKYIYMYCVRNNIISSKSFHFGGWVGGWVGGVEERIRSVSLSKKKIHERIGGT